MKHLYYIFTLLLTLSVSTSLLADTHVHSRVDAHAPIGVMGDHAHNKGETMFSYRFMRMNMSTIYDGAGQIIPKDVKSAGADYLVTPTEMSMDMHMAGIMHAPTDKLTLTAMLPHITKKMDHETRTGATFTRSSDGIGDLRIGGIYKLYSTPGKTLLLNGGISLPTGSIDETDGTGSNLPYAMQLGTGTYDLLPGFTWIKQNDHWSWGMQAHSRIHLGTNSNDYRWGNTYTVTPWISKSLGQNVSTSFRLQWHKWDSIEGADPELNSFINVVPTAHVSNQGGERIDLFWGINWIIRDGFFKNHRFALEAGVPVYQDLNGPQLGTDFQIIAGWQYAF